MDKWHINEKMLKKRKERLKKEKALQQEKEFKENCIEERVCYECGEDLQEKKEEDEFSNWTRLFCECGLSLKTNVYHDTDYGD